MHKNIQPYLRLWAWKVSLAVPSISTAVLPRCKLLCVDGRKESINRSYHPAASLLRRKASHPYRAAFGRVGRQWRLTADRCDPATCEIRDYRETIVRVPGASGRAFFTTFRSRGQTCDSEIPLTSLVETRHQRAGLATLSDC